MGEVLDEGKVIYHYCDASAFHGILSSRKLWLSDAYYMNDYTEHRLAIDIAVRQLNGMHSKFKCAAFIELLSIILNERQLHPFVGCFSRKRDVLSQWRAYADDGAGFAIGFSYDGLNRHRLDILTTDRALSVLHTVAYENSVHVSRIDEALNKILQEVDCHWPDGVIPTNSEMEGLIALAYLNMWVIATQCKQSGFEEEDEVRIVYTPRQKNLLDMFCRVPDIDTSKMHFRVGANSRIVPYFKFPFEPEDVVEIVLGPKSQSKDVEYGIRLFLKAKGFDLSRIAVTKAKATYIGKGAYSIE